MVLDRPARAAPARATSPSPSRRPVRCSSRSRACGVCRTDLHIVDGELTEPKLPLVPGHQIVARVLAGGERFARRASGSGVPWLGWTCGDLPLLPLRPREPLRPRALHRATTSTAATPSARSPTSASASPLPDGYEDLQAAPLLCAGPHRPPDAAAGRRRRAARDLRLRRRRPHRLPGRASTRAAASSPSRARTTRRRRRSRSSSARSGPATRSARRPRSSTPRSSSRRPASSCPAALEGGREGRHGRVRRHPHERHPGDAVRAALGRAGAPLGGEPHPRATPRSSSRSRRAVPVRTQVETFPLEEANEALDRLRARQPARRRGAPAVMRACPERAESG